LIATNPRVVHIANPRVLKIITEEAVVIDAKNHVNNQRLDLNCSKIFHFSKIISVLMRQNNYLHLGLEKAYFLFS